MNDISCIVIFLVLYVVSTILNWFWIKIAFSKEGILSDIEEYDDNLDYDNRFIFFPVLNTICALRWLIVWPYSNNSLFNIVKKILNRLKSNDPQF